MTDRYSQYLKISSSDGKNTVEQFVNQINKRADKGRVEFGADIEVTRIEEPSEHTEGFNNE